MSLNGLALRRAVGWAATREPPDLVAVTGDLLSHSRGESALRQGVARLHPRHGTWVVLGNHDVGVSSDPFSSAHEIDDLRDAGAVVLRDTSAMLEVRGRRVQVAGIDPRTYMRRRAWPQHLADPRADLRILLSHFPRAVDRAGDAFHVVLAGHTHAGQICVPTPWGKVRFGALRSRYVEGVYRPCGTALVVSRGTGTGFVPFRFFARPEATELVLRAAG